MLADTAEIWRLQTSPLSMQVHGMHILEGQWDKGARMHCSETDLCKTALRC
jgi:hypothetical protein